MTTHVVILAQGQQRRLPDLTIPKQALPLKACGDVPLIVRTIALVGWIARPHVTVVCGGELADAIRQYNVDVELHALPDPGNSSLRGCARYLEAAPRHDRTVVLLGDVCYSWRCAELLLTEPHAFVGTSNLSPDRGELWGVTWEQSFDSDVITWMKLALARHPPFDEYQCGQLRQWLFAGRDPDRYWAPQPSYIACDDYTRDFDMPSDLLQLDATAQLAADDDRDHGKAW